MSDRALSNAAEKCNNFLLGRDVAETTINIATWICMLEVVSVVSSMILACRGGDFKPRVIMLIGFVPCTFRVETPIFQTVGSERLMS